MIQDKSIKLGNPSYVWRFGQDRRLDMIRRYAPLENAAVLDVGCGVGAYVEKFYQLNAHAFGIDVDQDKLEAALSKRGLVTVARAASEALPFPDNLFDVVLLHEVIEHVDDDRDTICEAHRVAKHGGRVVVFAPNRLHPFETHGAYLGKRYVFGNIPLVGYLPDSLRRRLAPHVRAYRSADLRRLFEGLPGEILIHSQIYPGYDKIARNRKGVAGMLRRVTYTLENTPLRALGLSHFLVWCKG